MDSLSYQVMMKSGVFAADPLNREAWVKACAGQRGGRRFRSDE